MSFSPPALVVNPGEFLVIKWTDPNLPGPDGYQGLDDVAVEFSPVRPGLLDASFNSQLDDPSTNGLQGVNAAAIQPDGKIVMGGNFDFASGAPNANCNRLLPSGALDPAYTYTAVNGSPFAIGILPDGKIMVGGNFDRVGTTARDLLARFLPGGGVDPTFTTVINPGSGITKMTHQRDGKILVMGGINGVNGVTRPYLIRLNADGTFDSAFNPQPNSQVQAVAQQPDGKLIVAGFFTGIGGGSRSYLARLNLNGTLDTAFQPSVNSELTDAVLQADGKILIAGSFTSVGGQARRELARLNPNGTVDTAFNPSPDDNVFTISVQTDGKILCGGLFSTVAGAPRNHLARLLPTGAIDPAFTPAIDRQPFMTTTQADGRILIGGRVEEVNGVTRKWMARLTNDPATETLAVTGRSRVEWQRGGSSPEAAWVSFELSSNGGGNWNALGFGTRIAGGWELTGLTLPSAGLIRARANCPSGRSSFSLLETREAFTLIPDITVRDGAGAGAPELIDGQTAAVDFGTTRQLTPVVRTFTVANPGTDVLRVNSITAPPGFTLLNGPALPAAIIVNGSLTFDVRLNAAAPGTFTGSVEIGSDDPDEGTFDFPVKGTVITPEIVIHAGAQGTAPEISDGQTAAADFGTTRQATPVTRSFLLVNTGTAPLLVTSMTVPAGFSLVDGPALPATIGTEQSAGFSIRFDAAAAGPFGGSVRINSDDLDEAEFDFPLTALAVTPEIGVHDGATSAAPPLTDGQMTPVDFGRNIQGTPGPRSFTLTNSGTAELLVSSLTIPPGYTAVNAPALPLTIGINQSVTLRISLTTLTVGIHTGAVVIASDDLDEPQFDFMITGEVFIPEPVSQAAGTAATLNRQTGLLEQTIHITNDTTATVPAYNLIIRGLPAGVEVNNASETRADGSVVVYVRRTMEPHSSQDLVLEYYVPGRGLAAVSPQLSTEVVLDPRDLTTNADGGLAINKAVRLNGGEMLLEFTSEPGKKYQVEYSPDGKKWQVSLPAIRAAANRTQWIDRGLPRTDSPPATGGSRMYRVRELSP